MKMLMTGTFNANRHDGSADDDYDDADDANDDNKYNNINYVTNRHTGK